MVEFGNVFISLRTEFLGLERREKEPELYC